MGRGRAPCWSLWGLVDATFCIGQSSNAKLLFGFTQEANKLDPGLKVPSVKSVWAPLWPLGPAHYSWCRSPVARSRGCRLHLPRLAALTQQKHLPFLHVASCFESLFIFVDEEHSTVCMHQSLFAHHLLKDNLEVPRFGKCAQSCYK